MIYEQVKQRIRFGIYQPDSKLSENRLAAEFGCSRIPVREAFLRLRQEGLVESFPHSGTYVRGYSEKDFQNAIEIRAYLEALATDIITTRGSVPAQLRLLYNTMQQIIDTKPFDLNSFGDCHFSFHRSMILASRNEILIEIYDRLHLQAIHQIFFNPMTHEELLETHAEHLQIITYLENKDSECSRFMIKHLLKHKKRTACKTPKSY